MLNQLSVLAETAARPVAPRGDDWKRQLKATRALIAAADVWELAIIMRARAGSRGVSWNEVGETAGMSRQAAWQRYAHLVDRPESASMRVLKARIDALVAERDLEIATADAEMLELPDDAVDVHEQALRDFEAIVSEHIAKYVVPDWEALT